MITLFSTTADATKTFSNFNWNAAPDNYAFSFVPTASGVPTQFVISNNGASGTLSFTIRANKTAASTSYGTTGSVSLAAGSNTFSISGGAQINSGTTYWVYFTVTGGTPTINYNNPGTPKNAMWRSSASNIDPDTLWFSADIITTISGNPPATSNNLLLMNVG